MSKIQFVVFSLGKEEYAVEISKVQEIIRTVQQMTKIPGMPSYVGGMINLRGRIVPIIDLKKRFGFEQGEQGEDSRFLILSLGDTLLGIIVDDVSEVLFVEEASIEKLVDLLTNLNGNSIQGICKVDGRLILWLNTLKLTNEIIQFNEIVKEAVL